MESKRSNKLYFKTDEVLFNEPSSKLLAKSLMGSRPHHAFVFVSVCKLRRREYGGCTGSRKKKTVMVAGQIIPASGSYLRLETIIFAFLLSSFLIHRYA